MDDRILVWAGSRDARLTLEFLQEGGIACAAVRGWEELVAEWEKGAAGLVVAGEYLTAPILDNLEEWLDGQPAWSDPAIIIVGVDGDAEQIDHHTIAGNISVLQKPLALRTLLSTVRAAQRARRRQYQVRDLLNQKDDAERRKDEYLAMLAHELRNPLAPLRTGLKLLRLRPAAEIVNRTHATMERQISNLTRLVDDLLDVSRITQGKVELRREAVDLRTVIVKALELTLPMYERRTRALDVALTDAPCVVAGDEVRLAQVVSNLLSNAVKYGAGKPIAVEVRTTLDQVVLTVTDHGSGIDPAALPRIFERFERASPERRRGGLGLGLYIAREIVQGHGGGIRGESEPGIGSTFTVSLPHGPRAPG